MATFEKDLHLPVTCVDASERFLSKLAGVTDPEKKRKIIGAEFIAVFDEFALEVGRPSGSHGLDAHVLSLVRDAGVLKRFVLLRNEAQTYDDSKAPAFA